MKTKLLALGALFAALCASVQGQTPVDKTPLLHLSFDQVSGTTVGSIVTNTGTGGLGMNGTLNATANGTIAIVGGGKFGNCLSVSGTASSDTSVRIANSVLPLNGSSAWTVAMWVQTTTPGGTYAYQGSGGWGSGNTTFYLNQGNGSAGTTAGGVRNSQNWVNGNTDLNDGLWHHIAVTCDGSTRSVWVDGAFQRSDNDWAGSGTGNQFWIGGAGTGENDGQANLNGLVDEVYVFNQTLNTNDIQGLFNNNILPIVPVTMAVNPVSGYRGQVLSVSATVTPASGTVTNVTANLSAISLSATANMVLSSGNVFTNTFTVPATAPVGARNLSVTARTDTAPFIGSAGATFTVIARPPTNAILVTQLTNVSAYEYTSASFRFGATNDAPNDAPFAMAYSWYTNNVLVSSNMGPNYTILTTPAHNGMQVQAIARVADTNFSSLTVTSALVTLTVNPGSILYTNGLKEEFFAGGTRPNVEIGNVAPPVVRIVSQADSPGNFGNNHARRYSGYFIPPTNDSYVFFVASDDDCDLFLSTDSSPNNKRLIAQETTWSGTRVWQGSTASINSQKRSDQWTNNVGETPYSAGIPLVAGQQYYIESVMHNGSGGDNWAITYQTTNELFLDSTLPVDGTASRMTAASNNIAFRTFPGSTLTWVTQPLAAVKVFEGQNTNLISLATSDAEMIPNYQWYLNGAPIGGNSSTLILNAIPASYNNAQIKVVASTALGGLSITSSVTTLAVQQAVFEPGWVAEKKWMNTFSIAGAENGSLGTPTVTGARPGFAVGLDNPSSNVPGLPFEQLDSSLQQIGSFVAPSNGSYVFFITSHDGGNLFLSTDNTPGNKRLIAQEAGWSNNWWWNQAGGGGTVVSQKRSDQYTNSAGATPYASGIPLVAGTRYYMEVDHTTSRWGNEQVGVTYRIMDAGSVTAPADGTLPNVVGNVVGMSAIRCSYVAFTQEPANATAAPMGYATFSADGTTDGIYPLISSYGYTITQPTNTLLFQWYKNGVAIPGATSKTVTLGPLLTNDNGATIYCSMRALGYANDALQPIWSNSTPATLTVSPPGVFETGVVRVDWWSNTTSRVAVETGSAGSPTYSFVAPKFESPTADAPWANYVNRVSGYFIAPSNGVYVFFVNSDDDADLFISTDGNPANKKLIAQETGWSNPFQWISGGATTQKRSDSFTPDGGVTYPGNPTSLGGIPLVAGQVCWLEGVHHNGSGGNNFEVTYKEINEGDPADGSDSRLAGNLIGSYVPRIPWVAFLQQPVSQSVTSGGNAVTFTAQGTNPPSVWVGTTGNPNVWLANPSTDSTRYQWYKNGAPIPGATGSSYTQPFVLPSDQGAQFYVALRALGYADDSLNPISSNSVTAVLTVVTDTVPPMLSYAATFENTNLVPSRFIVNVTFNEWMDATTLSNALHYSIAGATITNVSVASNHRTVQLLLDAMPTLPLSVTVNGVKDLSGNSIVGTPSVAINAEKLTFSDIGTPGVDPAYPSYAWVTGNGGYIISAEGSDIWNTTDGCNFAWELKTNNFDMVVRGVGQTPTSAFAKQGLMVRETLDANSREWSIQNEPLAADGGANRIDTAMRDTTGAASVNWSIAGTLPPPSYPNAWLRLKRTGTVLDGFYSTNGVDWVHATSYDTSTNATPLDSVVYVGLCTTAHNNDVVSDPPPSPFLYYNTAEYANYTSSFVPTPAAPRLTVTRSGNSLNISWSPAVGHLESSPTLGGAAVWQNLGSGNPATVTIGPNSQFFRVVTP